MIIDITLGEKASIWSYLKCIAIGFFKVLIVCTFKQRDRINNWPSETFRYIQSLCQWANQQSITVKACV